MTTIPGASPAVEEEGLQDKVAVLGTCLVSACKRYLENGSAKFISFWDPADAGYVMNQLAVMVLEGKHVADGMDLGVPGYKNIKMAGKVLYGSAWVDVTKKNMNMYNF
jgi:simple sugar transport system substrate-binding protein